jgi:hypothetical protein
MRLPEVEPLPPMSVRERIERGMAARDRVPLDSHRSAGSASEWLETTTPAKTSRR